LKELGGCELDLIRDVEALFAPHETYGLVLNSPANIPNHSINRRVFPVRFDNFLAFAIMQHCL
jgi:hypothetical protein